jgi:hypothetical protein
MRWARNVACMREERKVYKVLVGKRKERRPLGRPSCRWEGGIKMGLKKIGWGMEWIQLSQIRTVNMLL